MTVDLALSFVAIMALLLLSAFFAGSEAALMSAAKRVHQLESDNSWSAKQSLKLIADRERVGSALFLGNTFVNVLASALATALAIQLWPGVGVLVAAFAMTAIILVFAEALPKALAASRTESIALSASGLLGLIVPPLAAIASAIRFIIRGVLHFFGLPSEDPAPPHAAHEE